MRWRAGDEEAGLRLDAALSARSGAFSRAEAQRLIDRGLVLVDGSPRPKSHRMAPGQLVEVAEPVEPAQKPEPDEVPFEVAWEDPHLLVVDKPAGVVVHPGAGRDRGTLAQALAGVAAGGPDPGRAGIVHRLDRDTSGLLVVARSEEVHAALQRLIRERAMRREYLALVDGRPDARTGVVDAPVGRDPARRTAMSTGGRRARSARTHFELREALPRTTLLGLRLETGRTHQIRVHMAAIGHPVCGDRRYGGAASGSRLGLNRQFLHSAQLAFSHPMTGELVRCESKPPADLRRALDVARREPVPGGPDGD